MVTVMRKRIMDGGDHETPPAWHDLDVLCRAEVSSEDPAHPLEAALVGGAPGGWRASRSGAQVVTLRFDAPLAIRRVVVAVVERDVTRTQELVLCCATERDPAPRELRRQRWNFSPGGSTREVEDWRVEIDGVTALELSIIPDVSGGDARASLERLRIA